MHAETYRILADDIQRERIRDARAWRLAAEAQRDLPRDGLLARLARLVGLVRRPAAAQPAPTAALNGRAPVACS